MENNTNNLEYIDVPKKSLLFKTNRNDLSIIKHNLLELKQSINSAKSINYPNRSYLLDIYNDIVDDSHLSALIKHRKSRILGLKWSISKNTGNIDKTTTILFNQRWFKQFIEYCLDAIFYGNSLIEILNDKGIVKINLIPRENVIPEFKQVKIYNYSTQGDIDYSVPIYNKTLIDINNNFDSRNLGELLPVSKLILFKNEVMLNWSQYIELFGQPIRVATSDTDDPNEQNQIFNFLKELGRSGFVIKNSQTQLDFIENNGSGKSELYLDFINTINSEISKKILGGTMLTDDGSSKSQSEVHERGSLLFTKSDIIFLEHIINDSLIPLLLEQNILNTKSLYFSFDEPEIMTIDEKLKVDQFLLDNFEVDDLDYFEKRYGTKLKIKQKQEISNNNNSEISE